MSDATFPLTVEQASRVEAWACDAFASGSRWSAEDEALYQVLSSWLHIQFASTDG